MKELDEILTPYKLNKSAHDTLIKSVQQFMENGYGLQTAYRNARYKIPHHRSDTNTSYLQSDIDLLQAGWDKDIYRGVEDFVELSPEEVDLYLYEMKTFHNQKNYHKALKQLKRSSKMIKDHTNYQNVYPFYCFWEKDKSGLFVVQREEI